MAAFVAINENSYVQTANIGIPEPLIPQNPDGAAYALTRSAHGALESVNIDVLSGATSAMVTVSPDNFAADGGMYRCDVNASDVFEATWVNVLPYDSNTAAFLKFYALPDIHTFGGGFSFFTTELPSAQLILAYTAFRGSERGA